ncbi:MAG: hypothetical protein ABWJ98_00760 [Hydrogenothermaceae bacterium]
MNRKRTTEKEPIIMSMLIPIGFDVKLSIPPILIMDRSPIPVNPDIVMKRDDNLL